MCAQVQFADIDPAYPIWDRPNATILVARSLTPGQALHQVRAMLAWLGADQPDAGATCWCPDRDRVIVPGLSVLVPRQRRAMKEAHGAA